MLREAGCCYQYKDGLLVSVIVRSLQSRPWGSHEVQWIQASEPTHCKTSPACVPLPTCGRHKGGVERFGRFGYIRVRRHDRKVRFGLVDLSRLDIHSAESGTQLAVSAAGRGGGLMTSFVVGGKRLE